MLSIGDQIGVRSSGVTCTCANWISASQIKHTLHPVHSGIHPFILSSSGPTCGLLKCQPGSEASALGSRTTSYVYLICLYLSNPQFLPLKQPWNPSAIAQNIQPGWRNQSTNFVKNFFSWPFGACENRWWLGSYMWFIGNYRWRRAQTIQEPYIRLFPPIIISLKNILNQDLFTETDRVSHFYKCRILHIHSMTYSTRPLYWEHGFFCYEGSRGRLARFSGCACKSCLGIEPAGRVFVWWITFNLFTNCRQYYLMYQCNVHFLSQ